MSSIINNINNDNDKLLFLNDLEKRTILYNATITLRLVQSKMKKTIFVYSYPKVGSTSIVTSLRLYASHIYNIIHIHDELMLEILAGIKGISVNELILYTRKKLGHSVIVINIYRSPIERKISVFFEKISEYHFNTTSDQLCNHPTSKIINRFNRLYPHIGIGDKFIDKYDIAVPAKFNFQYKLAQIIDNDIQYISIRLKDSNIWGNILYPIIGIKINIVPDYESAHKPIKNIYAKFKQDYRIPIQYIDDIKRCPHFNYYYSSDEITKYLSDWFSKSTPIIPKTFTIPEIQLYNEISSDNQLHNTVQQHHYRDNGCLCNVCFTKRKQIITKIRNGILLNNNDIVVHNFRKR